ncbi:MAG: tetratricopeptide repeat protein [Pyrinomonadaceae bacterium]
MFGLRRLVLLGIVTTVLSVCAMGQDLGSSNRLFGGAKPVPANATKKSPAKLKTTAPKPQPKAPVIDTGTAKRAPVKNESVRNQAVRKESAKKADTTSKKAPTKVSAMVKETGRTAASQPPKDTAKPKEAAASSRAPTKKVDIKRTEPLVRPEATGAAADELFEDLIEDGNFARDERKYSVAENAYRRAKALKPRDARAVYGLGNLYSDQQRWEESEAAYRKALELDPTSAVAHIALSYVLSQPIAASNLSERYEEAEKLARQATQLVPQNALAFDQMGVALELRGLIGGETENAYRRAIRLDPNFAPAYAHLGRLLRRRGQTRESAVAYQSAFERSNDVATKILVAEVMQSEQRFAESEDLLRSALDDDPRNPSGLLLLARSLMAQGQYPEAENTLRISLDVSPNGFTASSLLGNLYIRQERFDLAERTLLQAARFVSTIEKRQLAQQFEIVGDGYMKTRNAHAAARAYQYALTLDKERESLSGKMSRAQRVR